MGRWRLGVNGEWRVGDARGCESWRDVRRAGVREPTTPRSSSGTGASSNTTQRRQLIDGEVGGRGCCTTSPLKVNDGVREVAAVRQKRIETRQAPATAIASRTRRQGGQSGSESLRLRLRALLSAHAPHHVAIPALVRLS